MSDTIGKTPPILNDNSLHLSAEDFNLDSLKESLTSMSDEFPKGSSDAAVLKESLNKMSEVSRRRFMGIMAASTAFATTRCTSYKDKGTIVAYNKKPEEGLPGKPVYYASTCGQCESACGTLVKVREGRPIKIDGNPDHPVNQGRLCAKGQSHILDLYDPNRLQHPKIKNGRVWKDHSWDESLVEIRTALVESLKEKKEIALIIDHVVSPTTASILDAFKVSFPNVRLYNYNLFNNKNRHAAWQRSFGRDAHLKQIHWEKASLVVSFDYDFLGDHGNSVEQTRYYSGLRDVVNNGQMARFYSIEGRMSLTGMNADRRIRISPDGQLDFILALAKTLVVDRGISTYSADSKVVKFLAPYSLVDFVSKHKLKKDFVDQLVSDLISNQGSTIVSAGDHQSEDIHVAVNFLNSVLSNDQLYLDDDQWDSLVSFSSAKDLKSLVEKMTNGLVGTLIHVNSNPVFQLPSDLGYVDGLRNVKTVVSLSHHMNESTEASHYALPLHHDLESWGDTHIRSSIYSLKQPVISPLFSTKQSESVLLALLGKNEDYHAYLMKYWESHVYSKTNQLIPFKRFWFMALHDGFVEVADLIDSTKKPFQLSELYKISNELKKDSVSITLQLQKSPMLGDGRFSGNGWLQEIPHPVTKLTWDNAAMMSASLADRLNVKIGDWIEITASGNTQKFPAFIQPGMVDNLVSIDLGYGRRSAGPVGTYVGHTAQSMVAFNAKTPLIVSNIAVRKVPGSYALVSTQEHHRLDRSKLSEMHLKRHIIQETTRDAYEQNPTVIKEDRHKLFSLSKEYEYNDLKWEMSIDLNKCTGCNACVASCNVENNIPVVGKDQVAVGREMHWMRIDRYYSGTQDDPDVALQPMLCQHCDNAPCEVVCPVAATTHSPDGLNDMAYNRCVGTRYCSNNCAYKVRRFNYFNFRDHAVKSHYEADLLSLLHNPEVTVRSRGVMEKCSFCVQRLRGAQSEAKRDGRDIQDGDVQTACQQGCPSEAISFGNVNDETSEIHRLKKHELGYNVLEELNGKPSVTYLAKVRNR